ncbi:MAG: Nif3-like dinuclear metal center hexameric protein [Selenomonadaceae bacterium]|nr:Nif3-like dinuclear metal center hexameric protein [Selenomonadaceae bacterium]
MSKANVQTVCDAMNRIAPKHLAEDWDNPGLLVGDPHMEINKILVCLDISDDIINRAVEIKAQMIVTHHPMIFRPIKHVRTDLPLGSKIRSLLKNDIAVFAAHTNLDSAVGGVNDVLAEKLGLVEVKTFDEELSLGRIGKLQREMSAKEFAFHVKKSLKVNNIRLINAGDFLISKVGICGGAGSEFILKAKFLGADAFVTGDVKYHEAQAAFDNKIHVVDAGHFATEVPIVHVLVKKLKAEFRRLNVAIEVVEDETSKDFFNIM